MTMKNKFIISLLTIVIVGACTYDFPENAEPSLGQTDFTKMVSVGNSITAGFMDGALYTRGQDNSFPAIIAQQASFLGGGTFTQPTVASDNGCFNPTGGCTQGRLVLKNPASPAPAPTAGDNGKSLAPYTGTKANLNNWGVPGVTIQTALTPLLGGPLNSLFNPYYARIASAPGTSTLIGDAAASLASGGTFFTYWLGSNDVLGYAIGGASDPSILTSQDAFQGALNLSLSAMLNAKADAEGAVANIPDVTGIPFFTTLNPLAFKVPESSRAALGVGIDQLNAAINGWNAAINANTSLTPEQKAALLRPTLSKNFDVYPLIIFDETLSDATIPTPGGPFSIPKIRNLKAADNIFLCLTAAADPAGLPGGMGISPANPINEAAHDKFYLTPAEQAEIKAAVDGFNTKIAAAVSTQAARLVLIDINTAYKNIKAGTVSINGSSFTSSISPPFGAFSVDGIHPNARCSAYIANLFIEAINAKWDAKIPICNPNDYAGNALPIP